MTKAVADFCALRAAKSSKPAYAYMFSRQLPGDSSGAFHSADLWYIFHSFRYSWRPFTTGDHALSRTMIGYWTNFVKNGDPNGAERRIWTPYTAQNPAFMDLNVDGDGAAGIMTSAPKYLGSTFKWR